MRIKYVGPFRPGVEIVATGEFAEFDKPIEVDDDLGKSLLEQAVWKKVRSAPAAVPAEQEAAAAEEDSRT